MSARFTYSRWDGTQRPAQLDADAMFDALGDDLLYHGDVSAALRRMMQEGLQLPDGSGVEGLQQILEQLREERLRRQESASLGGVYEEIASELRDIIDEERHSIDNAVAAAEASGNERRAEAARSTAGDRNMRLDLMPNDLAGMVRELSKYPFESADASRRFDQLVDRLREQLVQQQFDQLAQGMGSMTPDDIEGLKHMLADLNELLEAHKRGEDTDEQFADFMAKHGQYFPNQPGTVEELLQQMAQQMAAMQAMLNSMTPEQRAQLQALSNELLGDLDLGWQMDQLGANLAELFPQLNWNASYDFSGDDPMGFAQAMQAMTELGELDQLESMLQNAANPVELAEVDIDRVRDLMGDATADSLDRLARLTKMLEEAGLIGRRDGRLELTPSGLRALGRNALRDLFSSLEKAKVGQHTVYQPGHGHERTYQTKPYEFGDPFRLDLERTLRNALRRQGVGTPVRLAPVDFEIDRTEHMTRSSTVLLLDLSMSMPMRGNFLPAKRVATGLHHLISTQFPHDYLGIVGFGATAREVAAHELPEISFDLAYGTNMQHALGLARQMLANQNGSRQVIMITDGEPTSHLLPDGQVYFNYPPVPETVEETLREVVRCTRADIRINTFVLDATAALTRFIERLTQLNGGRAFYTTNDALGDYVLVDFLEQRRSVTRRFAS